MLGMKIHTSALTLLHWLEERESASVREIAAAGLMSSREASDVIRYGIRNGAITKASTGSSAGGAVRYKATGALLPMPHPETTDASFDGLLNAWGIAQQPPELPVVSTRAYLIRDTSTEW
jgi:hypothetical protein